MIAHVCAAVVSCVLGGAASQPSTLSREQLLAGVEKARGRIKDLDVTFTYNVSGKPPRTIVARSRMRLVLKGEMCYMERAYRFGGPDGDEDRLHHRRAAYRGGFSTIVFPDDKTALIQPDQTGDADPSSCGFFQVSQWTDPMGHVGNYKDSLLAAMRHPKGQVRPKLDTIDGHACYVLEVPFHQGEVAVGATYWIDVKRGFSLLKTEYWRFPGGGVWKTCNVTKLARMAKGIWLPVAGTVKVKAPSYEGTMVMQVELDRAGKPKLKVNTGVPDSFFSAETVIPPGYRVHDKQKDKSYKMPKHVKKPT